MELSIRIHFNTLSNTFSDTTSGEGCGVGSAANITTSSLRRYSTLGEPTRATNSGGGSDDAQAPDQRKMGMMARRDGEENSGGKTEGG